MEIKLEKRERRFWICAICVLAVALAGMVPVASAADGGTAAMGFGDLPASHWAYDAVMEMAEAGVVQGYPDGSFRPSGVVTYGEFIKMAVSVGGSGVEAGDPGGTEAMSAGDHGLAAHWATPYYNAGLAQSWFTAWDISEKSLDQPIPRALMALICSGILETEPPEDYGLLLDGISDVQVGSPYEYEIVQAYGAGLLAGYPDGSFRPQGTLTRAEAAVVISRLAAATAATAAAPPAATEPAAMPAAQPAPADPQPASVLDPDTGTPFPPPAPATETDQYGYTVFDEPYPAGIVFREENRAEGYRRVDYAAGDSYEYNPPDLSDVKLLIIYSSISEDTASQRTRLRAALEMEIPAWSQDIEADFFTFLVKEKDKYRLGLRLCAYGDRLVLMNRFGDYGHLQIMSEDCSGPAWELAPGQVKEEFF